MRSGISDSFNFMASSSISSIISKNLSSSIIIAFMSFFPSVNFKALILAGPHFRHPRKPFRINGTLPGSGNSILPAGAGSASYPGHVHFSSGVPFRHPGYNMSDLPT